MQERRSRHVSALGVLIIAGVIVAALALPASFEKANSSCSALAGELARSVESTPENRAAAGVLAATFGGPAIAGLITEKYPIAPAGFSCALTYWRVFFDPSSAASVLNQPP
jgi:hypothetical protein